MSREMKKRRAPAGAAPQLMRGRRKSIRIEDGEINYKNLRFLQQFVTERGKIVPRRVSGVSAHQQREISRAVKLARQIAFLSYTGNQPSL